MFDIEFTDLAVEELAAIRMFDRRRILDEVKQQLSFEPQAATRRRKPLQAVIPAFEHVLPIWELRVGDYRVFYDVNESVLKVYVRSVRFKGPEQTTAEITS